MTPNPSPFSRVDFYWRDIDAGGRVSFGIDAEGIVRAWGHIGMRRGPFGGVNDYTSWRPVDGNRKWAGSVSAGHISGAGVTSGGVTQSWRMRFPRYLNSRDAFPGASWMAEINNTMFTSMSKRSRSIPSDPSALSTMPTQFVITTTAELLGRGQNDFGQLGIGSTTGQNEFRPIATNVRKVSAGWHHSAWITRNGQLWVTGRNDHGQLGLENTTNRNTPVRVGSRADWVDISCGRNHTLGITADGALWAWGSHAYGQLGLENSNSTHTVPTRTGTFSSWVQCSAGEYHSGAVNEIGQLYMWGYGRSGRLGNGHVSRNIPTLSHQPAIQTDLPWVFLSLGARHGSGVEGGRLWTWGRNDFGQLGAGNERTQPGRVGTLANWREVHCGLEFNIAIMNDGRLWGWGRNNHGQVGTGSTAAMITGLTQIGNRNNWAFPSVGREHALCVNAAGELWAWGQNNAGQLGLGNAVSRNIPVRVGTGSNWERVAAGGGHSIGIRRDGSLWGWGDNGQGQVGVTMMLGIVSPVQVGMNTNWAFVSAGWDHTVAIRRDGSLWAWGRNMEGQLGDGTTATFRNSPTRIGTATDWVLVACGDDSTYALRADGSVWAWGSNMRGQLGILGVLRVNTPTRLPGRTICERVFSTPAARSVFYLRRA